MTITLFLRSCIMMVFQKNMTHSMKSIIFNSPMDYENSFFYIPVIVAHDGFKLSIQIGHANYCSSENGYRTQGHTWEEVEFGFPNVDEKLLHPYCESYNKDTYDSSFTSVGKVGKIPLEIIEKIFYKHGGVDWEETLSIEAYENMVNS